MALYCGTRLWRQGCFVPRAMADMFKYLVDNYCFTITFLLVKVSLGSHSTTLFVWFQSLPMSFGWSWTHLPLSHVARDMTQIPLIKVIQVPGQPPSVSDWFRFTRGSLIRANLVDFVQTVEKEKLNFIFGCYTGSVELPGDPLPPRRATHENETNTEENKAKTWIPQETIGTFFSNVSWS